MAPARRVFLWRALGCFAVLEAMLAPAVLFWPNFRENLGALKALAPLPMLKDMVDQLGQGGVGAYVVGQQFFKGCNTLGTAAAVMFAMGAVAGEAHRRTLEIWLARPVSRARQLTERYAAGAGALLLPVFASTATIPWLLSFVDESMDFGTLMLCATHQSFSLLAIYSVTFLLSCLGRNPTSIAVGMLFLTTFQFAIYLVKQATHYSFFRLTDVQVFLRIIARESLDWSLSLPLIGISAVCFVAAQVAFARRVP